MEVSLLATTRRVCCLAGVRIVFREDSDAASGGGGGGGGGGEGRRRSSGETISGERAEWSRFSYTSFDIEEGLYLCSSPMRATPTRRRSSTEWRGGLVSCAPPLARVEEDTRASVRHVLRHGAYAVRRLAVSV